MNSDMCTPLIYNIFKIAQRHVIEKMGLRVCAVTQDILDGQLVLKYDYLLYLRTSDM